MTWIRRAGRAGIAAAATSLALTCGGDDGPSGNDGSIQVAVSPATLSVPQGGSGAATVSLIRGGGFDGAVTLTIAGLPAGVTTTVTPAQLSGNTASAAVDVNVAASVAPATYTATITATAQGVSQATTTYQLIVTAAPNYALTVTPSALTIPAGTAGSATVNIERTNFTGAVALALVNPPAGITGVFNPTPSTTNTATLAVSVAANVAVGSYPLTIQGTATGPGVKTTTLTVTVPAPAAGYSINLSPATLSVQQGASVVVNITLARTNFSGTINLAFENPPAGITGTLVPATTTGNSSIFTINVGASVPLGFYQLSLRGTATGLTDRVAFVQLTVTAPATSGNVQYLYCDVSQVPIFFAYQDGTGAWQAVTGSTSGGSTTYAFNVTQGRGGVLAVFRTTSSTAADVLTVGRMTNVRAMATQRARSGVALGKTARPQRSFVADVYSTEVVYASTAELTQDGIDNCAQTQPTKTVTGTAVGVPANAVSIFSLGSSTEAFQTGVPGPPPTTLTFTGVPSGTIDFVGTSMPFVANVGSPPNKAVVFRNLNVPDGGSLPSPIDFNGPAASVPATANAAITGRGSDDLQIFTTLVTANSDVLFWFDLPPSTTTTRPWAGLSNAAMLAGDFHGLVVFAAPHNDMPDVPVLTDFRVALKYVGPVANENLALGPVLSAPATSQVAAGAYPRFRFQGTLPPEYNKGASIDVLGVEGAGNVYSIIASGAYLAAGGNALAYDFSMPDVTGLAGFPAAARLTGGTNDVALGGAGFTGPGIFDLRPNLGSEFKAASKVATINVP